MLTASPATHLRPDGPVPSAAPTRREPSRPREWTGVGAGELAQGVRGALVLAVIGAGMGAVAFAVVALVGAIHAVGRMCGTLGMANAALRHFSTGPWTRRDDRHLVGLLGLGALGALTYTALVALLVPLVLADWFPFVAPAVWLWTLLLLPLTAIDHIVPSVLRARRASTLYALFFAGELAVGVLAAVYGGLYVRDLGAYYMALTLGKLVMLTALGLWWFAAHRARTFAAGVQRASLPVLVRFGVSTMIVPFGIVLVTAGDRFVLGRLTDPATLGVYAAVAGFALALWKLPHLVYFGLYAEVVRSVEARDPIGVARVVRGALHAAVPMLVVGAFVLSVFVLPSIHVLFGSDHGVHEAVVWMLLLAAITGRIAAPFQYILEAHDRGWFVQTAWIGAGVGNLVLAMLVVPVWGAAGAAATSALVFLGLTGALMVGAWRHVDMARVADATSATWLAGYGIACLVALAGAPIGLGAVAALVSTGGIFVVTAGAAVTVERRAVATRGSAAP